jgi:hypothetical protein
VTPPPTGVCVPWYCLAVGLRCVRNCILADCWCELMISCVLGELAGSSSNSQRGQTVSSLEPMVCRGRRGGPSSFCWVAWAAAVPVTGQAAKVPAG